MSIIQIVHYLAALVGVGTLVIGILAMLKPEPMSKNFGIGVSGFALPYVVSTGVRDIFIGLCVFVLFWRQEWVTLGCINFCIAVVALSDFFVVRKHGHKMTSLVHLFGAALVLGLGYVLCFFKSV